MSVSTSCKPSDWLSLCLQDFAVRLQADSATPYPCHFGSRAEQLGHNTYVGFTRSDASSDGIRRLAGSLVAFAERARTGPRRQSLVVFVGPPDPDPDLARDGHEFWRILLALRDHDPCPWPAGRASNSDDPHWQWCFNAEPWFILAGSPAYRARRSRVLGPCLTLVFQTQRVFEGLSGATPAGRLAKQHIRAGLRRYDSIGPHPHLGDPQYSSTFKWRQYVLPDDQTILPPGSCPFGNPHIDS